MIKYRTILANLLCELLQFVTFNFKKTYILKQWVTFLNMKITTNNINVNTIQFLFKIS